MRAQAYVEDPTGMELAQRFGALDIGLPCVMVFGAGAGQPTPLLAGASNAHTHPLMPVSSLRQPPLANCSARPGYTSRGPRRPCLCARRTAHAASHVCRRRSVAGGKPNTIVSGDLVTRIKLGARVHRAVRGLVRRDTDGLFLKADPTASARGREF